jgi:hypothetical protein
VSWGIFDGADVEGGATLHVLPVDEFDLIVRGHATVPTCPCAPVIEVVSRWPGDENPGRIYSHREPTWPGAVRIDELAGRVVAGLRRTQLQ